MAELNNRMQQWVQQWADARDDRIEDLYPYDESEYPLYLQWYYPRTRTRLLRSDGPPLLHADPSTVLYPAHVGYALHQAVRYVHFNITLYYV